MFSHKGNKLYIGFSPDLKRRIRAHNGGFVKATKNRKPISLVYYEAYLEESDARRREQYLKGGNGRKEFKIQLLDCLRKLNYEFV